MPTPLAITMGEPAGIGPDLILMLYARRHELGLPPFAVYGHGRLLAARAERLGLKISTAALAPAEAEAAFATVLPIVDIAGDVADLPGSPSQVSGAMVIETIRRATLDTLHGACRGLVTGPIAKQVLYGAGFRYPGHTEFLAALCAEGNGAPRLPVMMLAHEDLRAVPLTIHVPLSAVPGLITGRLIADTIRIVARDLRTRFGIAAPKLAVCGLNPHAGEGGTIGDEDLGIIAPALTGLRDEGIDVDGPLPADTVFYPPHWRRYDAVIAMYHDQALIPIKTIAFEDAVNVTLGLPIVRTSPDHGTAFDIAGSGKASASSMLAAIRLADRLTRARA